MIDESDIKEVRRPGPPHCLITKPCRQMKPSLTNLSKISLIHTLMPLPITLKHHTSLDNTIHGKFLHPSGEEFSLAKKKGFSSIAITARRYLASLSHVPKEITTDPASSLCTSNDLLMKASVSSDEQDQQCRYLDSAEHYTRAPESSGFLHSRELPLKSSTTALQYLNSTKNSRVFISCVYIKKVHASPRSVYYIDRSFFLPIGQLANFKTYKSTMSIKVEPRSSRQNGISWCKTLTLPTYNLCRHLTMPAMKGSNTFRADQTQPPNPICEIQCSRHKEHQEEQKSFHDRQACQEASSYLNMEGEVH